MKLAVLGSEPSVTIWMAAPLPRGLEPAAEILRDDDEAADAAGGELALQCFDVTASGHVEPT